MPKVESLTIPGLELLFHSDDHLPPHLHVRKPWEWEAKVYLLSLTYEVVWSGRNNAPSVRQMNTIIELVGQNLPGLLMEWEKKVCRL